MSFSNVDKFEAAIADFYGAPYAVATDCCTHAIELSLRMQPQPVTVKIPTHTYISVPFTLMKLDIPWAFEENYWSEYYRLGNTRIIDAAVYFKKDGYINDTLMCLSFQFKKPLNLGRGGAILCNNYDDYCKLQKMVYDGRTRDIPWAEQKIDTVGYHYYMTPETAVEGIKKLPAAKSTKRWTWDDYPYLPDMPVFNKIE